MNVKIFNSIYFLFLSHLFYYILLPWVYVFLTENEFLLKYFYNQAILSDDFGQRFFYFWKSYTLLNNYNYIYFEFFTLFILIFIYFYLNLIIKKSLSYKKIYTSNEKNINKEYKILFFILILVCSVFLLKDIYLLYEHHSYNNFQGFDRNKLWEIIDNRKTYLNIIIIISVCNFKLNPKVSYFAYFLVISFDYLSASRFSTFYLSLLHIFINIDFNKKNIFKLLTLFLLLGFFLFIRIYRNEQNFLHFLIETTDVRSGSHITFFNLSKFSFYQYLNENINFFLKNFFYLNLYVKDLLDLPWSQYFMPHFAGRGVNFIISYFFVFVIYLIFFKLLLKRCLIFRGFLSTIYIFLVLSLFRGNFVHNLNFILKLYLLILISMFLLKKILKFQKKFFKKINLTKTNSRLK